MRRLLTLLTLLTILTAAAWGQQAVDRWFVIDQFSGLQFYLDETSLPPGQSLEAKNVQFRKVGTVGALEGVRAWEDAVSFNFGDTASTWPPRALAILQNFVDDSDRVMVVQGAKVFNTAGDDPTFALSAASTIGPALWEMIVGTTQVTDTQSVDRAAYWWRPGWEIRTATTGADEVDTIDWIFDNGMIFMTSDAAAAHVSSQASFTFTNRVHPILPDETADVQLVEVSISGKPGFVILQAGMEPWLWTGDTQGGLRYFGIADSGRVEKLQFASQESGFLVDNSKIGLYGRNELAANGYWLAIGGAFKTATLDWGDPIDSTLLGGMYRIDSNTVDTALDGNWEFRMWFRPGFDILSWPILNTDGPNPSVVNWERTVINKQYLIVSAPIFRSAFDSTETPTATVQDGGRRIAFLEGTIDPHIFQYQAHYLEILADSLQIAFPDTVVECRQLGNGIIRCETTYVADHGQRWIPKIVGRGLDIALPVRSSFIDTVGANDSQFIEIQGEVLNRLFPDFETNAWQLWRVTIPWASHGIVYLDRLYLAGDPTAPNTIAFSDKSLRGAQLGAFPLANLLQVPSNGDVFVAFALIYDWLVVFQRYHTFVLRGDPDGNFELVLALPDEGCIAINSIVMSDNKIVYLSHKGLRIFDGNTAQDFAQAIKPAIQGFPRQVHVVNQAYKHLTASAIDPNTGDYWFSMPFGTDTVNSGSFIWNSVADAFSFSDEVFGGRVTSGSYRDTTRLIFGHPGGVGTTANQVFNQSFLDSVEAVGIDADSMDITYITGWLDFGWPQEKKYVSDGMVLVRLQGSVTGTNTREFVVTLYKDFDSTSFFTHTINVGGLAGSKITQYSESMRLRANTKFEFLKIKVEGFGLNVMDLQRIAFRYNVGADAVRARSTSIPID